MINDIETKKCLARMSGIEAKITGEVVNDYQVLYAIQLDLKKLRRQRKPEAALQIEIAGLSLVYLQLYHPSALIRHEAVFTIGEYGGTVCSYLTYSALNDPDPVVRHEATLAITNHPNKELRNRKRWVLEHIAKKDRSRMVRDSARVALNLKYV